MGGNWKPSSIVRLPVVVISKLLAVHGHQFATVKPTYEKNPSNEYGDSGVQHRRRARVPKVLVLSPSVVSEARIKRRITGGARCSGALSIQRLEGSRPRLRWTRSLCKFNRGKERRGVVPRQCGRVRHLTVAVRKQVVAKKDREEGG